MYPLAIVKDKGGATRICLFLSLLMAKDFPTCTKPGCGSKWWTLPKKDQATYLLRGKSMQIHPNPWVLVGILLQVGLIILRHNRICCSKKSGNFVEHFKSRSTTAHPVSLWLRNQCGVQKRGRNMLEQQPPRKRKNQVIAMRSFLRDQSACSNQHLAMLLRAVASVSYDA